MMIIAWLGIALAIARAAFAVSGRRRWAFAIVAAAVSLVPIGGLPIAGYVRGLTGDLSITSLVLLILSFGNRPSAEERTVISGLVVAGALALYPMALGLGPIDPYRWGYAPSGLLVGLSLVALAAWRKGLNKLLVIVLAAVSAHIVGILESDNLWDYLIDPWVAVASMYTLARYRRGS